MSDFSDILLHAPAPLIDDLYALITSGALHSAEGLALLSHESFSPPVSSSILATFDSGSDVHVLTVEAAQTLFASLSASELRIVGVSGSPTRADLKGHLVVMVESPDGAQHHIDLGLAHAMRACPLNLLSVSLLLQVGAIVHFEPGNCFFQPHAGAAKIPFQQRDGMFQLEVHRGDPAQAQSAPAQALADHLSVSLDGHSFATSGNLQLWHRRLRHMSKASLMKIFKSEAVRGFKLTGKPNVSCGCDTCSQVKIQRSAVPHSREFEDRAFAPGHVVSTDVKQLPFASIHGYKYVINFVDHCSRFGVCYFMRSKKEVPGKLKEYLDLMRERYNVIVRCIQSDRGSEYFSQEGETLGDRERASSAFTKICKLHHVRHVLRPIEMKEKLAELWFKEHFRAANAMLWEGRLSPAFWADALAYSQFLFNRAPNDHIGSSTTPWTMLTGEKPRWDKLRVFGCDCFEHIPNNEFYKVPGIPRGRRLIFVGFGLDMDGWRCFDPETRRYFSTGNLYFNEDFSSRVDALRHHDQRRALLKRDAEQPDIMDDFADPNSDAVRSLYLDPDSSLPPHPLDDDLSRRAVSNGPAAADAALDSTDSEHQRIGPLTPTAIAAEHVRNLLREGVVLRPLRLLPVGRIAPLSPDDQAFLRHARLNSYPLVYLSPCPKRGDSARRYLKYMHASTLAEASALGATKADIDWDFERGFISFPRHEPDLPGHVHCAFELAHRHGVVHALLESRRGVPRSFEADIGLARVYHTSSRASFHQQLETVFEPEVIVDQLSSREKLLRFSEHQFAKVLNSSAIDIDFSLSPEPTKYADTLPDRCVEAEHWRGAMDDEMRSMERFSVYRRVPKSAAHGRQVLGCRWVYKRKVNKFGQVYRYRARLVAQGFLQRAYDSYQPDETYSPVVHKDTLRMFLSLCAAEDLEVYQMDLKSAFLQAPLKESIFLRAPPGYSSTTADGEEEILELSRAIYGLKQSSACFFDAMHEHLVANGYVSILGDPCLFRKVLPDGGIIMACTYIDDVTYGVSSPELAQRFLSEMRERFVIEEGEGKQIDFLLGMAVSQNLVAGTVRLDMTMAISKLCAGVLTDEELVKSSLVETPMLPQPLLKNTGATVPTAVFDYLSVVGSLLHIANCVRCDISFAVGVLARHSNSPGRAHVQAAKRVLQYLYATRSHGITYTRPQEGKNIPFMFEGAKHPLDDGKNHLQTFADSDYAADETRRSTMGSVIMMNGGPISWSSVLGKTVAMSTCEAEVNAAVVAAKDALHLKQMLMDLGYADAAPIRIGEDNAACIAQAESGIRHVRKAKHYEVRLRFLQQLVVDKQVEFTYTPSELQLADFFTKPLDSTKFIQFRDFIMSPAL